MKRLLIIVLAFYSLATAQNTAGEILWQVETGG